MIKELVEKNIAQDSPEILKFFTREDLIDLLSWKKQHRNT